MRRVVARMGGYLWRPLTDSDADTEFVVALRSAERFAPWFYNARVTPESHRKFIVNADERGEINWLIEQESDGKYVGLASIYNFDRANRKEQAIKEYERAVRLLDAVPGGHKDLAVARQLLADLKGK